MKAIFILLMFGLASVAAAQRISGTVKDERTKQPLAGAIVRDMGGKNGSVTDSTGHFNMLCEDSLLIVSYVGYRTDTISTVLANGTLLLRSDVTSATVNITHDAAATSIRLLDAKNLQVLGRKELCKAACCNLSESFETNASVDGSFTDAITGTRQIRMLGLEGYYSQITLDNIPNVRGLSGIYGLGYIPGPWVDAIYLSKGVGSVTSGYESITGQINVATKNTSTAERLHVNAYTSNSGRNELNIIYSPLKPESHEPHDHDQERSITTSILAHGAYSGTRADMNGDGFMDNPLFKNLILQNDWSIEPFEGFTALLTGRYLNNDNTSGQMEYSADQLQSSLWGAQHSTERVEAHGKIGYVFQSEAEKSLGSQITYIQHDINGSYGYRGYTGNQRTLRGNLLYSSASTNERHKLVSGATILSDEYNEELNVAVTSPIPLNSYTLKRTERVAGVFSEYTFKPNEKFIIVAGARADIHNIYGAFYTPRVHIRLNLTERSVIKYVSGSGRRIANPIMDNVGFLGGNRNLWLAGDNVSGSYGLKMEEAWNNGLIWVRKGKIFHREQTLTIDAYHTRFVNQTVVDYETPGSVYVYNLQGKSFSNSFQLEWHFSPARRLDVRAAYRWLEARTQYGSVLKDRPLTNRHRAFMNLAYETKASDRGRQFRFDCTVQWIGKKRRPAARENEMELYTPAYFQLMGQATFVVKKNMEIYVGAENLGNFRISDAIIDFTDVSSATMDASQTWGPVFGAMGYLGLRYIMD